MSDRLVADTNVLVSGILSPSGPPGLILELLASRQLELIVSSPILAEYREGLTRAELGLNPLSVDRWLQTIDEQATFVASPPWPLRLPDPDDEIFLAAAEAGVATLVTGNLRHYPAERRRRVPVQTPREFIDGLAGI